MASELVESGSQSVTDLFCLGKRDLVHLTSLRTSTGERSGDMKVDVTDGLVWSAGTPSFCHIATPSGCRSPRSRSQRRPRPPSLRRPRPREGRGSSGDAGWGRQARAIDPIALVSPGSLRAHPCSPRCTAEHQRGSRRTHIDCSLLSPATTSTSSPARRVARSRRTSGRTPGRRLAPRSASPRSTSTISATSPAPWLRAPAPAPRRSCLLDASTGAGETRHYLEQLRSHDAEDRTTDP